MTSNSKISAQRNLQALSHAADIPPVVIGFSMVKNEEDIIEQFVRHNINFLDCLFILENGSVDNTSNILYKLRAEGLPIVIFNDPSPAYNQDEKSSRILKSITSTFFPDYVIPLDADEFIQCLDKECFVKQLQKIPLFGQGFVKWQTFLASPHLIKESPEDVLINFVCRRKEENPQYYKAILNLNGEYSNCIRYSQGNHIAQEKRTSKNLPHIVLENVTLAHFPIRTNNQAIQKAIIGWIAYLLKNPKAKEAGQGYQWYDLFKKIKKSGVITTEDLFEISCKYAQNKSPDWKNNIILEKPRLSYDLKYGNNLIHKNILSTIACSIEQSLALNESKLIANLKNFLSEKRHNIQSELSSEKTQTGSTSFGNDWHLENLFLDLPPMKYVWEIFNPKNILDVGCGSGAYLYCFKHLGCKKVFGLDGIISKNTFLDDTEYRQCNLSDGFDLNETFDMVICLEVLEHLTKSSADKMIHVLDKHASNTILFSAAEIYQPGIGHINCQPLSYWLKYWRDLGWQVDNFSTLSFRSLASFSWFRRNPLILRRNNSGKKIYADLEKISQRKYKWWSQKPKIVEFPLQEELPDDLYDQENKLMNNHEFINEAYKEYQLLKIITPDDITKFLTRNINNMRTEGTICTFEASSNDPIILFPYIPLLNVKEVLVVVDIIVPADTIVQLFYKTKSYNIFCEEQSIKKHALAGKNILYMNINHTELLDQFRLDPGNKGGVYALLSIEIRIITG